MADTGTAVATGDLITAAKMNLKLETTADRAALGVIDQSGVGSYALNVVVSETLTADRNLTITVNNAARAIDLSGNITLAGTLTTDAAVTVSGAFALTVTVTNTTNATIPAGTVTLMDLSTAQTVTGAKTFTDTELLIQNPAGTYAYTIVGAAIAAARNLTLPLLTGNDTVAVLDFAQTFTNKTLTAPTITGGTAAALTGLAIRSTGTGAYDLTFANSENLTAGRTLTFDVNNAARTIDIAGNVTLAGALTTDAAVTVSGAHALTITITGVTGVTLPTTGTLAALGTANTWTAAQTLDGNVDTVYNVTTSPIIDIGADVFATGTFIDIAYDTADTLTGALIGLNIDLGTNVTSPGATGTNITAIHADLGPLTLAAAFNGTVYGLHLECDPTLADENITGILVTMPGTYGTGTEYGIAITGDGQTITLAEDTQRYMSMSMATGVGINFESNSPVVALNAIEFATGYFISIGYDAAETTTGDVYVLDVFRTANALTLGADLYGINLDFSTNITPADDFDITGYRVVTTAHTMTTDVTTNYIGFNLPTAGAIVANSATAVFNWYGLNIQMPNVTETAGTMTAIGVRLTGGTVTTGGSMRAIDINGDVDTIINFHASPIVDIGADTFSTGYFMDLSFDTIETLTAQLTGIRIDWDTVVVTTGAAGTGNITGYWVDMGNLSINAGYNATIYGLRVDMDFTIGAATNLYGALVTTPATFRAGNVGVGVAGDGQTITIVNDADLYIAMSKANLVNISLQAVSPVVDIGATVLQTGYFISIDYDAAETTTGDLYFIDVLRAANALTLGGDLYGVNIDFNSNVTAAADRDVIGYRLEMPAWTQTTAVTTNYYGFTLPTAGALHSDTGSTAINWYGVNIQMPNIQQTAGTMTAIGIQLTEGTTTSGTINAININGSTVDTIINFSASPIIDIGADEFPTGTFIDIAYDAAETLTATIVGVKIDWDTQVVTTGGAGTGDITAFWVDMGQLAVNAAYDDEVIGLRVDMDFTVGAGMGGAYGAYIITPATYIATSHGIHVTGDTQTINIVNDAGLYISMAMTNQVDINLQAVTPVIDVDATIFVAGSFIDIGYAAAETTTGTLYVMEVFNTANALTLGGDLYGIQLDFSTNVVNATDQDVRGYQVTFAALNQAVANTTRFYGFDLPTAGEINQSANAGVLDWRGVNIQLPNTVRAAGTVTAYGVYITEGTTGAGSAAAGLYIDVDVAIDLVTLGNRIDLDADNDCSIRCSADDVIDIEITGTDMIRITFDTGAATGLIKSASATEIGFCVTNGALTVGSSGSVVIPDAAVINDAVAGDLNGAIAIDSSTSIEVRTGGAWLTAAVAGYIIQSYAPWAGQGAWYHPNMFWNTENTDNQAMVDETICPVCGEPIEPGDYWTSRGLVMYPNAYMEKSHKGRKNVHAIFGHMHIEREPAFTSLEERVRTVEDVEAWLKGELEDVKSEVEALREQVKELGAVPVA